VEIKLDHPHIRALIVCPLCQGQKDKELLVCWPCFRRDRMRYGNPTVEAILDKLEADLEAMGTTHV
jgi:hypothetical protein